MPQTFDRAGIKFQFPDNWTIEEESSGRRQTVTVYAPGGSFWTVAVHPLSADPSELAKGVVEAMQQEYPLVESDAVEEQLDGHDTVGYDMNFYYLDLTNSSQVRSLRLGRHTYTIFCQGEDRDFEQNQPVFRAMAVSLVRGAAAHRGR